LKKGVFVQTKRELLPLLTAEDRKVMETAMRLSNGEDYDFDKAFELLFSWCANTLKINKFRI
jgi:hypothetical protein